MSKFSETAATMAENKANRQYLSKAEVASIENADALPKGYVRPLPGAPEQAFHGRDEDGNHFLVTPASVAKGNADAVAMEKAAPTAWTPEQIAYLQGKSSVSKATTDTAAEALELNKAASQEDYAFKPATYSQSEAEYLLAKPGTMDHPKQVTKAAATTETVEGDIFGLKKKTRKLVDIDIVETSGVAHPAHLSEGWVVLKAADETAVESIFGPNFGKWDK